MRDYLPFFVLLLFSFGCLSAEKKNIVLIMADDVSPEEYGCYGNTIAKTPHIDKLASEGVLFETAWASAMCGPSRALIMTGRFPHRQGIYQNGLQLIPKGKSMFTRHKAFSKYLQEAGYKTAVAGKWHVGYAETPDMPIVGFDEYCLWEGVRQLETLPGKPKHTGAWEDDKTPSRFWHPCIIKNHHYMETKPTDYGETLFTDFICDFITRHKDQPFLAYYPMVAPHGARKGYPTTPNFGEVGDMGPAKDNEDKLKRFRALNDYIDICIGRIIQTVEQNGLADNTIIIYCADNGTAVTAKTRGVERGCRVPFIVYGNDIKKRGATKQLMDFSDIAPTLLDFAEIPIPAEDSFDGKSLKPFLVGESEKTKEYIYSFISTSRLVRNQNFMLEVVNPYLGYPGGRFYHTKNFRDGKGYENVTHNAEFSSAKEKMIQAMNVFPTITKEHPVWETKKGKSFHKQYTRKKDMDKHLYNHDDYKFYDESF